MTQAHNPIIIAIDGFSSSGKSTMARRLAARIGYRYIDSGAMYRAVTLYALDNDMIDKDGNVDTVRLIASLPEIKVDFAPAHQPGESQHTLLNDVDVETEIRSLRVSEHVSTVAAIPQVRHAMVAMQKQMGEQKGIVMDGRDIGTTVFPFAELKVFVDASAETRAQRRLDEMLAQGRVVSYQEILANVVHRDHLDMSREESPLRCADDAIKLDNSSMTIEQQDNWLYEQYKKAVNVHD